LTKISFLFVNFIDIFIVSDRFCVNRFKTQTPTTSANMETKEREDPNPTGVDFIKLNFFVTDMGTGLYLGQCLLKVDSLLPISSINDVSKNDAT
jgi:hypothetical protein